MPCPSCGCENRESAKFCNECGAPLPLSCPSCGSENRPGAKFCNECGVSLAAEGQSPKSKVQSLESKPSSAERASSDGERRQLTVMFCDLVGSTALSEQLDPEELHAVIRAYQEVCAGTISRLEGHIAQYLGDGLLVYFGYPAAHEDDAARAVRAGLETVDAIHQLNTRLSRPIQVRIGIHTGPVVVTGIGSSGRQEQLALGETPNIAARIQGHAAPDTVVISAATFRLVQGLFDCQSLGEQMLKGLTTPLALYQVQGASEDQSHFEAATRRGLTPVVGRDHEASLLMDRWTQVKERQGQVVLVSGEAGIGKSRLVQLLKERVASEAQVQVECRCSPYYQNSALYPVITHTDGVPLFVEELTKMVLESGLLRETEDHYELTGPLPPLAIPSTLQDSLRARLDRLSSVREVAQLGAMMGREFSYELLHAVSPLDEHTLQNGLTQLVEAELLYQRGAPPQATYIFKHALIQDTAYQSLLKSKRQQLHQQVARILEEQFPDMK